MITSTITATPAAGSGAGSTPPLVGPTGLSAYQVAVAAGYTGTVQQWLASLVGPGPTTAQVEAAAAQAEQANATAAANALAVARGALPHVPNNAALIGLVPVAGGTLPPVVVRDGFYKPGDGGRALYCYVPTPPVNPDNGAVVPASDGMSYVMDPSAYPPDVRQWGAVTGTTPCTAAIQAAMNAALTPTLNVFGQYTIDGTLVNNSSVTLFGGSKQRSSLLQLTTNASILINPQGGGFNGLSLSYWGTPNACSAVVVSGVEGTFSDFIIGKCYVGLEVTGVANEFENFEVKNYAAVGINGHGTNDNYFAGFILNAGSRTAGTLGGIRLTDKCEAFIFERFDILLGVYSITTDAAANAPGSRPAYNDFTDGFFDSAALGCSFNNAVVFGFGNCWWSGGRADGTTDGAAPGASFYNCEAFSFVAPRLFNCGAQGHYVNASCKRFTYTDPLLESNSVTASAAAALHFGAGCKQFSVRGGTSNNDLYGGKQTYGIQVDAGASDYYCITEHISGGGNVIGAVNDNGTGTHKFVANNF